jgi:hypothetical protein
MATDAASLAAVRASLVEGWAAMLQGDLGVALDTARSALETETDPRPLAVAAALAAGAARRAFAAGDREMGTLASGVMVRCLAAMPREGQA